MKPVVAFACLIMVSGAASAKDRDAKIARSDLLQKVVDCRAIADSTARLACYDTQVARLDEAEAKKEVVVVDQAEVKKARRGLFGLSLPDLGGLFGGGGDGKEDEGLSEIESVIKQSSFANNRWTITLEDGARWVQTELRSVREPKPGMKIRIKKAAMGSFMANINDRPAIRVARINYGPTGSTSTSTSIFCAPCPVKTPSIGAISR
jgi:hypothetical protein